MTRPDLLALTIDDLVVLSNRGIVKRAQREAEVAESFSVSEDETGAVVVTGGDATTTLAPDVRIEDGRCTCPAVGLCRHIVRAVLLYQRTGAGGPTALAEVWDPGTITDIALEAGVRKSVLMRARNRADGGVALTLGRSAKPAAHVHDDDVIVRFLVPHELAYARCSCTTATPCEHAVLAVLAFRELAGELGAGTVELGAALPVDPDAAEQVQRAVVLVAESGVASGREATVQTLDRAANRGRDAGWSWLADTLEDLAEACRRHAAADPTFTPVEVPRLAGEALARLDAMKAAAIPRSIVAGGMRRSDVEVRGGLLVGLGTRAHRVGATSHVDALLYDTHSARVVTIGRSLADGEHGPLPLARVAAGAIRRGISYADLGRGQLVATGAKITPSGRLVLGRRPAAVSLQKFDWRMTLGGYAVESFAEARAQATLGLPAALSARTPTNGFAVVAVAELADVGWDPAEHAVTGLLRDASGGTATLLHPYTGPGAAGVETLLRAADQGAAKFVAGYLSAGDGDLTVRPTGLVVEDANGNRSMIQPWVDEVSGLTPAPRAKAYGEAGARALVFELEEALGDLLTAGVGRPDASTRARWADLATQLELAGSALLIGPVRRLSEEMQRALRDVRHDSESVVAAALELAVMLVLAQPEHV